ncbi:MAG: integrase family protein [Enhydrobacter sp.]|nr:MAG: integrase family protein [Enhydrobacter sp.]
MHLTDMVVRSLPLQKEGQKDYTDDTFAGLTLRVGKRTKTFMLLVGSGKQRKRHTLGKYPYVSLQDARKKARIIVGQREQAPADMAPEVSFDDALDTFLKAYAEKNKDSTVYETTRLLNRHLKPALTGKNLNDAKKWRLVEIMDEIEKVSIRRHFYTAAFTFFRWSRRYDIPNPLEGVEKPPKSKSRSRLFTPDEFRTIWQASLDMGTYGLLYRVLLASGQRLGQIANLHSDFIDRGSRQITWPAELMKTNKEFTFPYGDLLHSLLPQGDGHLFTGDDGEPWDNWTDPHNDLLARCKLRCCLEKSFEFLDPFRDRVDRLVYHPQQVGSLSRGDAISRDEIPLNRVRPVNVNPRDLSPVGLGICVSKLFVSQAEHARVKFEFRGIVAKQFEWELRPPFGPCEWSRV